MTNEPPAVKKPITFQCLVGYGFGVWAIGVIFTLLKYLYLVATSVGVYVRYLDPYTFLVFLFFLMVLSYAYLLSEPKEGKVLTTFSRVFIVLGIIAWLGLAFYALICFFYTGGGGLAGAFIALTFPVTTLVSYLVINSFKKSFGGRFIFALLCLLLPPAHIALSLAVSRLL